MKIACVGLGFVGGNLADNLEERGYDVLRYSIDPPFLKNRGAVSSCDVVFVAVPTPTKKGVFDDSILINALECTGHGQIVAIKSTVPPANLRKIQEWFENRTILYSSEFLNVSTAREDTDCPDRNIIGVPDFSNKSIGAAHKVLEILPQAPYDDVVSYEEAVTIKYGGNCFFYVKNMFFNLLYQYCQNTGADFETVRMGITRDNRISEVHTKAIDKGGRGAGGACLPKDFASFIQMYAKNVPGDKHGNDILQANHAHNKGLLAGTGKDKDVVDEVWQ